MLPMSTQPAGGRRRGRRSGVRSNEAGHETRERLLDAAERLFAERGLDAVSVRDITEVAGANTASIHYHLGSKLDLIAATLQRRSDALGARRDELLDEIEARPDIDLRAVVEALVRPTAELAASGDGGRSYVAFLAALGSHAELVSVLLELFDPYTERFLKVLARATPDLPEDARVLRFAVSKDLINRVLGQPEGQIRLWIEQRQPGADAFIVDRLIDLLVGVFQASVSEPRFGDLDVPAAEAPAARRRA
jgi:AcrR family transcriptional regulator